MTDDERKAKDRERQRRWYLANRDKKRAYWQAYYAEYRESLLKRAKRARLRRLQAQQAQQPPDKT